MSEIRMELEDVAPAAPRPMIEVRGLRKEYGPTVALDGISFQVGEGEIFGFIGPNGAGKTTTLRILATLLEPTAGDAWIAGLSVLDDPDEARRVMGFMPDEFGVYDGITVWEYLDFFAGAFRLPRGKRRSIIGGVLELTDLTGLRDRMVATLSKGMRQRLCLAKTLIHDPRVLILDEPASAMDPRARIELRALLKELGRMGKTIIISSHILTELSDLCTSVGIIEHGKLLQHGRIESIINQGRSARAVTIAFHGDFPEAAEILSGHPLIQHISPNGREVRFEYLGDPGEFHAVVKLLVDRRAPILTIGQETVNLENIFLEVTRGDLQ
jgi:ABC-2 type transport system ATP-binding protein